jgi:hypothetical protein
MVRTRRGLGVLGTIILLALGCSDGTGPGSDPQGALIPAAREMTLRVGEEKQVQGSVLFLAFGMVVEDSRCPIDAMCVWAGNAMVELGIHAGMGPTHPIRLNTGLEPKSMVWNGVRLTLLELQPLPRGGQPVKADAYVVKVRLEPEK